MYAISVVVNTCMRHWWSEWQLRWGTICPNTKHRLQSHIVIGHSIPPSSFRYCLLFLFTTVCPSHRSSTPSSCCLSRLSTVCPTIPLVISPLTTGMRLQTARDTIVSYTQLLERMHNVKLHIHNVRLHSLRFSSHVPREVQASSPRLHPCREPELHEP
jgi:hypothetical protein